ncbi:MAG: hypothetical protein ACREUT_19765 [Steroidobacteraceae bacterium]
MYRSIVSCALLAAAVSAGAAGIVLASSHHDHGGVHGAEGRYSVVFPLEEARPNPHLTPGAANPAVTQANIRVTICRRGYSKRIRPPEKYTERLKRRQIRQYRYTDRRVRDYEEDHVVSLAIGGSPDDPRNLWPEPRHVIGGWGSDAKDRLEDRLHTDICRGRLPLAEAQRAMSDDWIAAYKRYVGPAP